MISADGYTPKKLQNASIGGIMIPVLLLFLGFLLLIKGADFFVEGSSAVARAFKIPPVIIGLTIVALGTSAPEAAVSIRAAMTGNNAIAVSNVIGSNIFNLLMVVGCCSAIKLMHVDKSVIKRDYPVCILITALMFVMLLDRSLTRTEGLILLLCFILYLTVIVLAALRNKTTADEDAEIKQIPMWLSLIYIVGGLIGIVYGGDMVVENATKIALKLGMSNTLAGLTIVALGTSLPELVTSMVACKKGSADIAIGNVVGSNLCNILFVLASSAAISPLKNIETESLIDAGICLGVTALMFLMCLPKKQFSRRAGITCILIYVIYTAYIIMRNYNLLPF